MNWLKEELADLRSLGPGFAAFMVVTYTFFACALLLFVGMVLYATRPVGPLVAAAVLYIWWKLYRWFAKED
jgi:hypothetical protein